MNNQVFGQRTNVITPICANTSHPQHDRGLENGGLRRWSLIATPNDMGSCALSNALVSAFMPGLMQLIRSSAITLNQFGRSHYLIARLFSKWRHHASCAIGAKRKPQVACPWLSAPAGALQRYAVYFYPLGCWRQKLLEPAAGIAAVAALEAAAGSHWNVCNDKTNTPSHERNHPCYACNGKGGKFLSSVRPTPAKAKNVSLH